MKSKILILLLGIWVALIALGVVTHWRLIRYVAPVPLVLGIIYLTYLIVKELGAKKAEADASRAQASKRKAKTETKDGDAVDI